MKTNVMIDIETLSTEPNAAVLSVAAVSDTEHQFYCVLDLRPQIYEGRHISPDTLKWWMQQSEDARDVFQEDDAAKYIGEAYSGLDLLLKKTARAANIDPGEIEIWAKPPSFDCTILKTLFETFGLKELWSFRQERCLRTLIKLLPHVEEPEFVGTPHHALSDAKHQLRYLKALLEELDTFRLLKDAIRSGGDRKYDRIPAGSYPGASDD